MLNKALSAICLSIDRDRHRDTGTHFRLVFKTFRQNPPFAKDGYFGDNRVWFAKWQLKANTNRLNLYTGVFGRAVRVVGIEVPGEIAA